MDVAALDGADLGTRLITYTDRDAILYALSVGAGVDTLDLVFERELRVLPTFALTFGVWACDEAGRLGGYDRSRALHGAQTLRVHAPLPPAGEILTAGRVTGVWDKGRSAVVDVQVESGYFTAIYSLFLRGYGGWGGPRGPSTVAPELPGASRLGGHRTSPEQAALYRLTGDREPLHIDPATARRAGFDRPILHGLCTLGIAAREVAAAAGAHPADLRELAVRFAAPVVPGDSVDVLGVVAEDVRFEARARDTVVLAAGQARFAPR
jgi:acyl dehydratase